MRKFSYLELLPAGLLWCTTAWMVLQPPQSSTEVVADFSRFTEGPAFDRRGDLFVSEPETGQVFRFGPGDERTIWTRQKNPNGHKVLADGRHVLCVEGAVLILDEAGCVQRRLDKCAGVPLRAPNDVALDWSGGFYFTDPGGSRQKPIGTIHHVDALGAVQLVAEGLTVPNGLVLSPDGAVLYVAETVSNRVVRFPVRKNGELGPLQFFASLPALANPSGGPDGITVDCEGNVYVAHLGMSAIQVLAPTGKLLRTLTVGDYDASNVAFGGAKMNELIVTGSTGFRGNTPGRVYRITMPNSKGVSFFRPAHPG